MRRQKRISRGKHVPESIRGPGIGAVLFFDDHGHGRGWRLARAPRHIDRALGGGRQHGHLGAYSEPGSRQAAPYYGRRRKSAGSRRDDRILLRRAICGDGYTFLLGVSGDQVNAEFLYPKLQYSPEKDLAPVSLIAGEALVFAARKDFPADGVQQFIDAAKKGTVSFGTSGVGSTGHLAGELLNRKIGGSLQAVPYKGGAPAVTDTMAGHLDVVIVSPIAVAQQIKTGQLKGIATTSSARLPVLSSVPTFKESGIDLEVHTWYMLMAPTKTPADVIAQMNAALNEALADKEVESKIAELGAAAKGSSPAELAELLAQERKRWGGLINEAGLKAQN